MTPRRAWKPQNWRYCLSLNLPALRFRLPFDRRHLNPNRSRALTTNESFELGAPRCARFFCPATFTAGKFSD